MDGDYLCHVKKNGAIALALPGLMAGRQNSAKFRNF